MSTSAAGTYRSPRLPRVIRSLLISAGIFVGAILLALLGAGSSYALWNTSTVISASTVSSGSTGLAINGSSSYTIAALDTTKLGPGQSVVVPLTVANTGSTPLNAFVAGTIVNAQTNSLASYLTIVLTQSATCTPGLTGGTSLRMAGFNTAASPYPVPAGVTIPVCLEVRMDSTAPASVMSSTATFTMSITADQVR